MLHRAIAFVLRESVTRIQTVNGAHERVPTDLGHNRRGADRRYRAISTYDRPSVDTPAANIEIRQAVTVNFYKPRPEMQSKQCTSHSQHGCVQNIQSIDFCHVRPRDRPGNRFVFDFDSQRFTLCWRQYFGIGQAIDLSRRMQNDRTGVHGTRQWTSSCLIDPGRNTPACARSLTHELALPNQF